ncbi:hypothetical protein EDB71_107179 [Vibrio crassostreae]|nr:hypothetical protein EDB71_107179 [Vibrio crassostreae]
MELILTEEQVKTLMHLVKVEMSGFCGDVGYAELSQIKSILEDQLKVEVSKTSNN